MIEIRCPNGHRLKVPLEYLGKKGKCRHCQTVFVLTSNESPADLPAENEREEQSADEKRTDWESQPPGTNSSEDSLGFAGIETNSNNEQINETSLHPQKTKRKRKGLDPIWRTVLALALLVAVVWIVLPMLLDIRESLHGEVAEARTSNLTPWEWFFGQDARQPPVSSPLPTTSQSSTDVVRKIPKPEVEPAKPAVVKSAVPPTLVQNPIPPTAAQTVDPKASDGKESTPSTVAAEQTSNDVVSGSLKILPNSKITVFDLPRTYADFAMNSETGDILAVELATKEYHFYRRADLEAGKVEPAKIGKLNSTPLCVCFKRYQKESFFVIGTIHGHVELLNGSTGEMAGRLLGSRLIGVLACSTNPDDPYVYFTSGAGTRDVFGISLSRKFQLKGVAEANSQIAISPDGERLYFEADGSVRCLVLGGGDSFNPPKVLQIFDHPAPEGRCLPDPFNYSVAAGTMLFSPDLKPLLEKMPKLPQCFFRTRPIVICGDGLDAAPEPGRIDYKLSAVSYNSCMPVGNEIEVPMDFRPETLPAGLNQNQQQFLELNSRSMRMVADDERQCLVFLGLNQMAIIPLSEFEVPEEPLIAARLECPAIMQAERDNTIRLVVDAGAAELNPGKLAPGMRLSGPHEIIWRPRLDQLGKHGIEATVKSGNIERTLTGQVEIEYPSLRFMFPIEGVKISPDGNQGVIWGKKPNQYHGPVVPKDKDGNECRGEVMVVDLKSGEAQATLLVPHQILSVDISDRQVLVCKTVASRRVEITLYDSKTLQELRNYPLDGAGLLKTMFWSDRLLVEMTGVLEILDCDTLKSVYRCDHFDQSHRSYFRTVMGGGPICFGMELNDRFQPELLRTPPRTMTSFPVNSPMEDFDTVNVNITSPQESLKGEDHAPMNRKVAYPYGRTQISLNQTVLLKPGQSRNGRDISLSVQGKVQGEQRIYHADGPTELAGPNQTIRLFGGGGSAIATIGERAFLWRLPEGLPNEGLSIRPKNPVRILGGSKPLTLSHVARGGEGPYEYWLLGVLPGGEIDNQTGEVTIDEAKLEEAALPLIEKTILNNQGSEERLEAVVDRLLASMIAETRDVLGENISGYPVAVPIHLRATDRSGEISQFRYCVVYEVSPERLKQRLSEAQKAQDAAVQERLAKAQQRADEIAKRKAARESGTEKPVGKGDLQEQPFGAMEPEEIELEVLGALDDALLLLKQGKFLEFNARFMPIDKFRAFRKEVGKVMKEAESNPAKTGEENPFYQMLSQFQGGEVELAEGGFVALIRRRPMLAKPEEELPGQEEEFKPRWEAAVREPLKGYGADLKKAIEAGIQSLDKREIQMFIELMFPEGELLRLREDQGTERLLRQFDSQPEMIAQMLSDLKECQANEPKYDDSGNEATFELTFNNQLATTPEAEALRRRIKFQKVEGSWRFYENTASRRKEISRMSKLEPPPLKFVPLQRSRNPQEPILVMEKIGSQWRIQHYPIKLP